MDWDVVAGDDVDYPDVRVLVQDGFEGFDGGGDDGGGTPLGPDAQEEVVRGGEGAGVADGGVAEDEEADAGGDGLVVVVLGKREKTQVRLS